tara:strand:+ start:992 stop:1201 length:210 start_codon:yes stop_codon:yes gene_type:complete
MNIRLKISLILLAVIFVDTKALANENDGQTTADPLEKVELKTSFIKGHQELPQVLYIVPWQEINKNTKN